MKYWLAVACGEHVEYGYTGHFMQVCHGKRAPLARMKSGDGIVYYSPSMKFMKKDRLMAFTAIGYIKEGEVYQFDMGDGFVPFRRDVRWLSNCKCPISNMLDTLEFTSGNKNWGYQLRFGILEISGHDFLSILNKMK
ncbi:EVE domain-containing protein [Klebsiella oxytoca]|nr:EVE domain-containing protein [Klebsiella oxytoca]